MSGFRPTPFIWLVVATLVVVWLARDVIGPFVVAAVVAYAFGPLATTFERRTGLPRLAVVALGYLIALTLLGLLVVLLAERLATELTKLGAAGPDAIATTLRYFVGGDTISIGGREIPVTAVVSALKDRAAGVVAAPGDALHVAAQVGEFGLNSVLALVIAFYLILDGGRFRDRALALVPTRRRTRVVTVLDRIHGVLGKWLRGQLLLIALVALVVYLGLGPALHLPYALALAVLTGVLEVLPLVGPVIATAIAASDAFVAGGAGVAIAVVVFFFVLRQIEDQVVMPLVIGRVVHLHPVATIFAVLVGLSAFGVLGGVLAVPVAAAANVVFNEAFPPVSDGDRTDGVADAQEAAIHEAAPPLTRPDDW